MHRPGRTSDTILLFLHVPKTAGRTLSAVIYNQYGAKQPSAKPDSAGWLRDGIFYFPSGFHSDQPYDAGYVQHTLASQTDKINAIIGHFRFGLHELVSRHSTYITLLRHPVDRVASLYYHILRYGHELLHERLAAGQVSLEEFVREMSCKEVDNDQIRRLSGANPEFGHCTVQMLEDAKSNLREYFSVVGLTERFDETLVLLKSKLGWEDLRYVPALVNPLRPATQSLPEHTRHTILEYNRLDLQLYEYAKSVFDDIVWNMSNTFKDQVANLRVDNERYLQGLG